jgi:hypothetical protein
VLGVQEGHLLLYVASVIGPNEVLGKGIQVGIDPYNLLGSPARTRPCTSRRRATSIPSISQLFDLNLPTWSHASAAISLHTSALSVSWHGELELDRTATRPTSYKKFVKNLLHWQSGTAVAASLTMVPRPMIQSLNDAVVWQSWDAHLPVVA